MGSRQTKIDKRVRLLLHVCWFGITASIVVLWAWLTVFFLIFERESLRAMVGVCGLIATVPSVFHYLKLIVRSRWSIRTGDNRPTRTFW